MCVCVHTCKPMFHTYLNTQLLWVCVHAFLYRVCVCFFFSLSGYVYVCKRQHTDRKLLLISVAGQWLQWRKEEGWVREGGDARLPCCPLSPEFWQPIRGKQIRPRTCFMFGELAVGCSETDAVDLWEGWTSHFPSPVFLHFPLQDAYLH